MSREVKDRTVYQLIRVDKPDDGTEIYVGSTSRRHWRRLREYKSATKGGGAPPFHERMREVGVGNWKITPLVTLKCDKLTIRKLGREWCEILRADQNVILPFSGEEGKWERGRKWHSENKGGGIKVRDRE